METKVSNYLPLPAVNIGIVGLGNRGMATLKRYRVIPNATFVALCDSVPERCQKAKELLENQGKLSADIQAWGEMLDNPNINLIYICTNWDSHTRLAIEAMQKGKHVALEVPAATTLKECRELAMVQEQTGLRCMMLENCCYDTFHLGVMGMAKAGLLGRPTHLEGAYIHYLAEDAAIGYGGNPYPTHALGPVCQLLEDDELASLVSIDGGTSINNTILKTRGGCSILIQFDETTPRPYNRLQTYCGTLGFVQKYPVPTVQIGQELKQGKEAEEIVDSHIAPEFKRLIEEGKRLGVRNLMNYIMDRRLIESMIQGRDFDISLSDALQWSSVVELSRQSAEQGGKPIPFCKIG